MISLEDYIKKNFLAGNVKFKAEIHITPEGITSLRLINSDYDEFDCIVKNNLIKAIEND